MPFLYLKTLHIIAVIAWFAGLFYLPRLFVYHSQNNQNNDLSTCFKTMEYKLYYYIMWPAAVVASITGISIYIYYYAIYKKAIWLHIKIFMVILLWIYHFICGSFVKKFNDNTNNKSHRFFRVFNEVPTILLIIIISLVVFKSYIVN